MHNLLLIIANLTLIIRILFLSMQQNKNVAPATAQHFLFIFSYVWKNSVLIHNRDGALIVDWIKNLIC